MSRSHLPYDVAVADPDVAERTDTDQVADGGPDGDDWTGLVAGRLPIAEAATWVQRPDCGAVVTFTGTARDHSDGRPDVVELAYEAYEDQVLPRLRSVASELRTRHSTVGRVVLIHRVGDVPVGQEAVVVAVSAPHRDEAFAAARFGIDAVKASVPIWKRERWRDGEDWGTGSGPVVDATAVIDAAAVRDPVPGSVGT